MTDASYRNGAAVERRLWPWAWEPAQKRGFQPAGIPHLVFGALHRSRFREHAVRYAALSMGYAWLSHKKQLWLFTGVQRACTRIAVVGNLGHGWPM